MNAAQAEDFVRICDAVHDPDVWAITRELVAASTFGAATGYTDRLSEIIYDPVRAGAQVLDLVSLAASLLKTLSLVSDIPAERVLQDLARFQEGQR